VREEDITKENKNITEEDKDHEIHVIEIEIGIEIDKDIIDTETGI
jgi:hypothetical protein